MASVLYLIGGLADFNNKGSRLIEEAHNRIESSLIRDDLFQKEDRIIIHQYPQRYCWGGVQSTHANSNRASGIPVFTSLKAEFLSEDLCDQLDSLNCSDKDSILIFAYSGGSAIFRAAFARALAQTWEGSGSHPWIHRLKIVFHIGGMTLGWQFNSEMNKILHWLGPVARTLPHVGDRIFPFQLYRGSSFIVNTRIAITKLRHKTANSDKIWFPEVCYILGTKDQYISPADAIEPGYAADEDNAEQTQETQPLYLEASGRNHQSILEDSRVFDAIKIAWSNASPVEPQTEPVAQVFGSSQHRMKFLLSHNSERYQLKPIEATDLDDYLDPLDNCSPKTLELVNHVIIILHGIRDNGYWAKRIAQRIKDKWRRINTSDQNIGNANKLDEERSDRQVSAANALIAHRTDKRDMRVVTLSYGYFSLWDFIRPGGRRRAVEWFQNAYADVIALYPNAEVSFIGHSNGTYLGTEALRCKEITYKLMLLAGSVVRQDFWSRSIHLRGKVETLLNIVAKQDWIVGLLPGGFEKLPFISRSINLGGAGAFGFEKLSHHEQLEIRGGHGAGIAEDEWEKIASYVCKVHKEDDQAQQIAMTIGMPIKGDQGIKNFNRMMEWMRHFTGFVIVIAFALWLLPYLLASLGLFSPLFHLVSGLPLLSHLLSLQPSPYKAFFILLLTSAVARGVLQRI